MLQIIEKCPKIEEKRKFCMHATLYYINVEFCTHANMPLTVKQMPRVTCTVYAT